MPDETDDSGAAASDHFSDNEDESESLVTDENKMVDGSASDVRKKYDPKDPLRPRRKKARRACYACQRAHLTCGDERPCKRCIKRGLADTCQDGVRKKARYLHDAPEEALGPVLGPNYHSPPRRTRANGQQGGDAMHAEMMATTNPSASSLLAQGGGPPPPAYPVYQAAGGTAGGGGQVPVTLSDSMSFHSQTSPLSPSFPASARPQMDSMLPQGQGQGQGQGHSMDFTYFDPGNPALYNFDLEGLNFGSQYAGWEFGILNKMALGAADVSSRENSVSQTTPTAEANYGANNNTMFGGGGNKNGGGGGGYDAPVLAGDYAGIDLGSKMYTQGNLQHGLPHAYAIAAGPPSLASPSTEATASPQAALDGGGSSPQPGGNGFASLADNLSTGAAPTPTRVPPTTTRHDRTAQSLLGKRQRDSAAVYASINEPYPYTAGFHNMISVIKDRLPLNKLLLIAKSLGEIRPSFIACTKDLTRDDLVFMEKCFQRTLVEFNDFLEHCCAPTIVCRRSGEVAAVNKEFCALTGWTRDVLLGKEPNRNVHVRSSGMSSSSAAAANGTKPAQPPPKSTTTTTAAAADARHAARPQPVFLAELLDDDSVVQFYRDFSQLAFEDSRGKVQRSCGLMQYRTAASLQGGSSGGKDAPSSSRKDHHPRTGILSSRVTRIDGEHGISRIEKDGKVNCTYCWTIKRDVFDIPMMIIINFLPRYYPDQEPHQLAV